MMILQDERKIVYSGHNVNRVVRDGIITYYVNVRVNIECLEGHHIGSDVVIYQVDKFRELDTVFMADEILKKYPGEVGMVIPVGIKLEAGKCTFATEITNTNCQPMPKTGGSVVFTELIKDIEKRAEFGRNKYKQDLMTNDGRDTLIDAYQEALDLCMYLKKMLMERKLMQDDGK